jgi:hypothetical protein
MTTKHKLAEHTSKNGTPPAPPPGDSLNDHDQQLVDDLRADEQGIPAELQSIRDSRRMVHAVDFSDRTSIAEVFEALISAKCYLSWCDRITMRRDHIVYTFDGTMRRVGDFTDDMSVELWEKLGQEATDLNTMALATLTIFARKNGILAAGQQLDDFAVEQLRIIAAVPMPEKAAAQQSTPIPIEPVRERRQILEPMAMAVLLTIGPNAKKIAEKVGVPRTTLLGWETFKAAYDKKKGEAEAEKENRKRRLKSADQDTDETDDE